MRIVPVHADHSILEVVFELEVHPAWSIDALGKLSDLFPKIKDDLPAFPPPLQFPVPDSIGQRFQDFHGPPTVEFASFRRDGT